MQERYGKGQQNQTSRINHAHVSCLVKHTCLIDLKLCGRWWPSALTTECAPHGSQGLTLTQSGKMSAQADFPWVPRGFEAHLKQTFSHKSASNPEAGLRPACAARTCMSTGLGADLQRLRKCTAGLGLMGWHFQLAARSLAHMSGE